MSDYSAEYADRVAKNNGAVPRDSIPILRFYNDTKIDIEETNKQGRNVYLPIVMVKARAPGDNKCEVPFVVEGWGYEERKVEGPVTKTIWVHDEETGQPVEKKIVETKEMVIKDKVKTTPWLTKLQEDLHNGFITRGYFDACMKAYAKFKETGEQAIDGTPLTEWRSITTAQQKNLMEIGLNSVEKVAEMTEEAMIAFGMGARDLKKKAQAFLDASTNIEKTASQLAAMQSDNESLKQSNNDLAEKLAALQAQMNAQEEDKPKRGRPRKEEE